MEQQKVTTGPIHISTQEVMARHGKPPWSERLLEDGRNYAVLICNDPGQSNDAHVHPDFNEWWIVMKGELIWEIADYPPIHAKKGDIIFSPAGTRHFITTVGSESSLRLGVTKPGSDHSVKGQRGAQVKPFPPQKLPNSLHFSLQDFLAKKGEPPWSETIILDDRNRATLICHAPGQSNRAHWHPGFDEWWAVLKGELTWQIGNRPLIRAKAGDLVFSPAGFRHHITTVGSEFSLRLAVTPPDNPHIYTDDDQAAPPPRV